MDDELGATLTEIEGLLERVEAHPRWRPLALRDPVIYTRFTVARDVADTLRREPGIEPGEALRRAGVARDGLLRLLARLESGDRPKPMA